MSNLQNPRQEKEQWAFWIASSVCMAILIFSAATFLSHQSLWVDETTQLSGIALGPIKLFPWLLGHGPDLGVPPDRMPPASYLLDMAWGAIAGNSEQAMRWFGLACVVIGAIFTAAAARRAFGPLSAVAATLFLALSPNIPAFSVEIRAYPIFLMLASASIYFFVRTIQADSRTYVRYMVGLTAILVLTALTHFFGLVFFVAVMAALLVDALAGHKKIGPLLGVCFVFVIVCGALVPFVLAAAHLSGSSADATARNFGPTLVSIIKLIYRFYGHPALASSIAATACASIGFGLALFVAVFSGGFRSPVRNGLIFVFGLGFVIVSASAFILKGFTTTAPNYNIWAYPLLAILLSQCVVAPKGWWRRLGLAGMSLLFLGMAYASFEIYVRPDAYAHGPQKQLFAIIDKLGVEKVDVVYDTVVEDASGLVFFAVRYQLGRSFPQYKFSINDSPAVRFDSRDPVPVAPSRPYAVVVRAKSTSAADLASLLRGPPAVVAALPASRQLEASGWKLISQQRSLGLVTTDFQVLQR